MPRFIKLLLLNISISGVTSWVIWHYLGKGFAKKPDYISLDFFNTIGVSFTIIGFVIAIYQIAELRNEQQIRNDAIDEFKIRYFKNDALYNFGYVKPKIQGLQREINNQFQFSDMIIYGYIDTLNSVNHIFGNIYSQQQIINCGVIIECGDLITLLKEVVSELHNVINQKKYTTFPKQRFNLRIGDLIEVIANCEMKLKS